MILQRGEGFIHLSFALLYFISLSWKLLWTNEPVSWKWSGQSPNIAITPIRLPCLSQFMADRFIQRGRLGFPILRRPVNHYPLYQGKYSAYSRAFPFSPVSLMQTYFGSDS